MNNTYCILLCLSGVIVLLGLSLLTLLKVEGMKVKDENKNSVLLNLIIAAAVIIEVFK